ncbi:S-layer homology domain-containing protein [Paenibacillus sp. PAMC21692]|uniref:S-layer homology domain-containing protein n=1 Tax=Paenibacillus sp. PAMC21692 TaxID=2762320 RepID=UPI00164D2C28|nr:S-layer homology domain-containing protein [Paenibacillus sp. PAMC21692]QNK59260.1 S-layer homology domain-containing protein [Paenibacillus sp. PAMC21692]
MNSKAVKRFAAFIAAVMLVGTIPAVVAAESSAVTTGSAVVTSAKEETQESIVYFVNYEDTTKISSVASFLAKPSTYSKDGVNYLRVDVQQVYDVKLTVAGKEGVKVGEYTTTVQGRNGAQEVTYFTFDYVVDSFTEVIKANTTYMVPDYFTEPQSHDLYVVINNDSSEAVKGLSAAIATADAAEPKAEALTAALSKAKKANSLLTPKADLEAALADLTKATQENPTNAFVYYVNDSDPSKLSSMAAYLANPKSYQKDGNSYLRLDVMQKYDVKVLVEEKEGAKVAEYATTVQGRQGAEEVTFVTFDFEVSDLAATLSASASYFVPGVFEEPQSHTISIVVNQNKDAELSKAKAAVALAEAAVEQTDELKAAITAANEAATYLNTAANIESATDALLQAIGNVNVFADTEKHWAQNDIAQLYAQGIVNGYENGQFAPGKAMTRAEFTKLVVTSLNIPATEKELAFADNDKIAAWASDFVKRAVAAEVITGYADNTFAPQDTVSRAEAAVILVKALKLSTENAPELTFADSDAIPAYAKPYVAVAVEKGLIEGVGNNTFAPGADASRAQAAAIILRALAL